jgi:hypothetical protein
VAATRDVRTCQAPVFVLVQIWTTDPARFGLVLPRTVIELPRVTTTLAVPKPLVPRFTPAAIPSVMTTGSIEGLIVKAALVAGLQTGLLVAESVYALVDPRLIEQPKNTAMPLTTVLVNPLVHESVPPTGFEPIARETTVELSPLTTWFSEFSTATTGC